MSNGKDIRRFQLAVIGAGMAGMAAVLYGCNRGLSTVQLGNVGSILLSSGLLDLLGTYPTGERNVLEKPWNGIEQLIRDNGNHPYAKIGAPMIRDAFAELMEFFTAQGLEYKNYAGKNSTLITALGTAKTTYCVPHTMWEGVRSLEQNKPALIVAFRGLKGFSSRQVAETAMTIWPRLKHIQVEFPESENLGEIYTGHMARSLESGRIRKKLAGIIKPNLREAQAVGLPAILGINNSGEIVSHLSELLGVPVFEIPMMPTSVPGMRLKDIFERGLAAKGNIRVNKRVNRIMRDNDGSHILYYGARGSEETVKADAVLLATGRFLGGGLEAHRTGIQETLLDLPVDQPPKRGQWHDEDIFSLSGHPVNQAGLMVDKDFRPADKAGTAIHDNLYAAGLILAHNDWTRMKTGSGVSLASAYKAVD